MKIAYKKQKLANYYYYLKCINLIMEFYIY